MKKQHLLILIIVIALGVLAFLFPRYLKNGGAVITDFDSCVAAGNSILKSYPAQCVTQDGKTFVENIGNAAEKKDLIRVTRPSPREKISTPLTISGEARGYWYFEASFPIELLDSNGNSLAVSFATAQSEWMTENFVPFEATLIYTKPATKTGILILKKDNPSGLPEHDDSIEIPVPF